MTSTEYVLREEPFTIRRRVRFGDCDPAGVVYTVRFSDYAVSAMDLFLAHMAGGPHLETLGIATPIKALSFIFNAPLRPNEEFDMTVTVGELRTRTFDLAIAACRLDGSSAFDVALTPICLASDAERRTIPIPAALRAALLHYQQRTGTAHASTLSH